MEVQYDSQVQAIGKRVRERGLNLQEVSDHYHSCLATAQRSFSHPRVPPIYHQFLAERETWKHYCDDDFPGKDPLYDCFVAASGYSEVKQTNTSSELTQRIEQLEVVIQQKDLVIWSKDELLKSKEETLMANKALTSGRYDIIKIREKELREEIGRVKDYENTIARQNRNIQEQDTTITQLKSYMQEPKNAATQKNNQKLQRDLEKRTNELKNLQETFRRKNGEIKCLKQKLSKYEVVLNKKESKKTKVKKEEGPQVKLEPIDMVKKEKEPQIKLEPMDYQASGAWQED